MHAPQTDKLIKSSHEIEVVWNIISRIPVLIFPFFLLFAEKILSQIEKQRYDGYYNNLAHPDWGAVGK